MKRIIKQDTQPHTIPGFQIWNSRRLHIGVLILWVLLVYGRTIQYDYTLDDAIVITENAFTKAGIKGLPSIMKYDSFRGFFKKQGKDKLVAGGRYRPLTIALFAIEWQVFGHSAGIFHAVNIGMYLGLVLLVYFLLIEVLKRVGKEGSLYEIGAWIGASIFAIHPLHVEVVANIKGADEILSLAFVIGALYLMLKEEGGLKFYFLSGLLAFLAMLSKENAIVLVVWAPALLYLVVGKNISESLSRATGIFSGIAVYLAVRFWVLGAGISTGPVKELMNNPFLKVVGNRYVPFAPMERISSILYTQWIYFKLMIFPHPLTHDYYPRVIPITGPGDIHVVLGWVVITGMVFAGLYGLVRRSVWALVPMLYIVPMFIVGNVFFPIGTHMGERFAFYSTLAISFLVGIVWVRSKKKNEIPFLSIVVVILLGYFAKTWTRVPVWKDDFTLFTHDVNVSPNSAKARNAAAGALVDAAAKIENKEKKKKYYEEALLHEREAIRIHPAYSGAYYIMGLAQYGLEDFDGAISSLSSALQLSGGKKDFEETLFLVYMEAAKYRGEKAGDAAGAIRYLEQAIQIKKDDPELYRLLGVAHGVLKHYPEAIRYFRVALKYAPQEAELYQNISISYRFMNQLDSAAYYANQAEMFKGKEDNK